MPGFLLADRAFETALVVAALLLIASVLGSRLTALAGVPSLLVFLGVGMLAGSEGPGGIDFTDYRLSFEVGSVALAFIIFDGGLRTPWRSVRPVLATGVSLATLGVLATALATALFTRAALGFSWTESLLLGAIVSSTDAAAVFSILRAKNLALKGQVRRLLELEAGSNDPAAVLLTIGVLAYATAPALGAAGLAALFAQQVVLGLAVGLAGGWLAVQVINHAGVEHEGLYSVLLLACVLLLFAGTSALGGSGFLAVYVAGLIVGNSRLLHRGSLLEFHDGIAWVAQIALFLTLGLLVFPSQLAPMWLEGLALAAFLMFVARPLCVLVAAPLARWHWRERLFVSWVGLRGAAPIILATLPWSVGVPHAEDFFNLVFFVVLVSVLAQGTTIPWLARRLGLTEAWRRAQAAPGGTLPEGFVYVEMRVRADTPAAAQPLFELQLPSGVVLTSVDRGGRYLVPQGDTRFAPGDVVHAFARPSSLAALARVFGEAALTEGGA
jgi:cell volume regulation protein A